ncbi:p7 [Hibiscus-infecting cilevirus]|nr:p7 [Hibiscus-infecting cilevirus]
MRRILTFIGSYSYASARTVFGGTWNAHTFEDSSFEFIFLWYFHAALLCICSLITVIYTTFRRIFRHVHHFDVVWISSLLL